MRTTRALAPTEAGLIFHEHCTRILRDLSEAELAVTEIGTAPRGTLRVSALSGLGEELLGPLLGAFSLEYPDLRVDVDLSDRRVNLVEESYDVALRSMQIGSLPDSSLVMRKLATVRLVMCAAPSYLARRGVPQGIMDLVHHDCLHYAPIPLHRGWSFETPEGTVVVPVTPKMQTNSVLTLRGAAIAGAGIVRTSWLAVARSIQEGALVPVLEEHTTAQFGLFAVYSPGKQALPKVSAFVSFLARELPARLGADRAPPRASAA
jgi:DNA-binding transcriptional LysR family regulator